MYNNLSNCLHSLHTDFTIRLSSRNIYISTIYNIRITLKRMWLLESHVQSHRRLIYMRPPHLIHDYTLCFTGSPCRKFSYYNYFSICPYYIVIHSTINFDRCITDTCYIPHLFNLIDASAITNMQSSYELTTRFWWESVRLITRDLDYCLNPTQNELKILVLPQQF